MTNRLRQWSQKSYSASDGRAASSLGDENLKGSPSTTHAENVNAQIPTAFDRIDQRRNAREAAGEGQAVHPEARGLTPWPANAMTG
jgi:hypothetical protein